MTNQKKKLTFLVTSLFLLAGIGFWFSSTTKIKSPKQVNLEKGPLVHPQMVPPKAPFIEIKKGEKNFFVNTPQRDWKKQLEQTLRDQGGDFITDVEIKHERSLIWNRDDQPLRVESVMITLTNKHKSLSHFRAMIEPQTGKILETWDKTIFEPADKQEEFRFKLDPRYTTAL
jgi:hypothetical protein